MLISDKLEGRSCDVLSGLVRIMSHDAKQGPDFHPPLIEGNPVPAKEILNCPDVEIKRISKKISSRYNNSLFNEQAKI